MMKKIRGLTLLLALSSLLVSCMDMRSTDGQTGYDSSMELLQDTLYSGIFSNAGSEMPEDAEFLGLERETLAPMQEEPENAVLPPITEPPDKYAHVDISFIAAGDNLIHPNLYMDAELRGNADKRFDFLPLYQNVAPLIQAADFAYINQETAMAGEAYGYSGWPCFNSPQQLGVDLVEIGFDIVSVANNHILDKGEGGYKGTLDFWNSQPVTLIGGFYDAEDMANIRTVEKDGVTIALLSYTYGTNGISLPAGSQMVVPYNNDTLITSDLAKAEEIADFTIVSIHWGDEGTQTPNYEQKRLAQLIADNGADVILGSHSHTLQPLTWLHSDIQDKDVLCIYSLGNFVSGQKGLYNMVGGLLSFSIKGDGDNGLCVTDVILTPTVTYYGADWMNTNIYLMDQYTDEVAATHGIRYQTAYLSPADARQYALNVIPLEFLPDYMK